MKPGKDYIGVGCGAIIVNEKNQVLLMRRAGTVNNEPGYWTKPGGTVEFGEKVVDAVKREIKEEIGVEIECTKFLGYSDHITAEGQHWVAFHYLAHIVAGEPTNLEPLKCDAIEWFDLNALPEKITQTTREPIEIHGSGKL